MEKDKILSLYENSYYKELDDSNAVVSRFPMLITGAALIVNIYVFLFRLWADNFNVWLILIIGLSALIPFIIMMIKFYMVFQSKEYLFIPTLDEIDNDRKNLKKYENDIKAYNYQSDDNSKIEELEPNGHFLEDMLEKYVLCSRNNRIVNSYRKNCFFKSLKWVWINMMVCITILVFTIVIHAGNDYVRKETASSTIQTDNIEANDD